MTLRIEIISENVGTTIKLIGRLQQDHLEELAALIQKSISRITLDLEQLNLLDVEGVRFLAELQKKGVLIVRGTTYMMDWISIERYGGK